MDWQRSKRDDECKQQNRQQRIPYGMNDHADNGRRESERFSSKNDTVYEQRLEKEIELLKEEIRNVQLHRQRVVGRSENHILISYSC